MRASAIGKARLARLEGTLGVGRRRIVPRIVVIEPGDKAQTARRVRTFLDQDKRPAAGVKYQTILITSAFGKRTRAAVPDAAPFTKEFLRQHPKEILWPQRKYNLSKEAQQTGPLTAAELGKKTDAQLAALLNEKTLAALSAEEFKVLEDFLKVKADALS